MLIRYAFLFCAIFFVPFNSLAIAQDKLSDELNELLAAAQREIDDIEDIINMARQDQNFTVVRINGEVMLIDRRQVGRVLDIAAPILAALIENNPDAAKLVGDYLGRSLAHRMGNRNSGVPSGLAGIIGTWAGEVASAVASSGISEGLIRSQLQARADAHLNSIALSDASLLQELQLRQDVYEIVDALMSEIQGDTPIQRIINELEEFGIRAADLGDRMSEYDGECPKFYSNSFGVVTNAGIPGYNDEILKNASLSECLHECIDQDWCLSVDYERDAGTCYVQSANSCKAGLRLNYPGNPYDHYFRIPQ